jgi:hypothetical protein
MRRSIITSPLPRLVLSELEVHLSGDQEPVIPELALIKILKVLPLCYRLPKTNREGTSWWDCPKFLSGLMS